MQRRTDTAQGRVCGSPLVWAIHSTGEASAAAAPGARWGKERRMSAGRIVAIGALAVLASCQPPPSTDAPPAVEYLVSDATIDGSRREMHRDAGRDP